MGATNVKNVFEHWGHLDHRPHRLLTYMALTALDKDNPPLFYGGREMLAAALGYNVPTEPSGGAESPFAVQAQKDRDKAFQAVKQAINVLIRKGAISRIETGKFRNHSKYALHLVRTTWGQEGVAEQPPEGVAEKPPKGVTQQPLGGCSMTLEGVTEQPPNEYEEKKGSFKGMSGQPANGNDMRPKVKTLMNDFSSQSEEQERNRQMEALQQQMSNWGKS